MSRLNYVLLFCRLSFLAISSLCASIGPNMAIYGVRLNLTVIRDILRSHRNKIKFKIKTKPYLVNARWDQNMVFDALAHASIILPRAFAIAYSK